MSGTATATTKVVATSSKGWIDVVLVPYSRTSVIKTRKSCYRWF
jgi:hypothetical protein